MVAHQVVGDSIELDGYSIVPQVLSSAEQRDLRAALGPASGAGRRGLLALPMVSEIARSTRLLDLVRPHFANEPFAVRAIYFDKSATANWSVPWHQDLTLAVRARFEVAGFGPWSVKDGIPHTQPPVTFLEQMLAVRLHLDDTDESNGALRVLPGSHRAGRLSAPQIQEMRCARADHLCAVRAGGALLMRPLLLHASSRSSLPRHRRILHFEYASFALPGGLRWHEGA